MRNRVRTEALAAFADAHGRTLVKLALPCLAAWKPAARVIAGAPKPEQVDANVNAVPWRLTKDTFDELK